jgi:hypothetical protein
MTEIEDMLREGLLTGEDIIQDIQLEEWVKNRCPVCGYGNVIGMCCDFCAWEYECGGERIQESNQIVSSVDDLYDNLMKEHHVDLDKYLKHGKKQVKKEHVVKMSPSISNEAGVMNPGLQKHQSRKPLSGQFRVS